MFSWVLSKMLSPGCLQWGGQFHQLWNRVQATSFSKATGCVKNGNLGQLSWTMAKKAIPMAPLGRQGGRVFRVKFWWFTGYCKKCLAWAAFRGGLGHLSNCGVQIFEKPTWEGAESETGARTLVHDLECYTDWGPC